MTRRLLTAAMCMVLGLVPAAARADSMLRFVEKQQNLLGNVAGLDGAHGVAVSPDGKYVYVAAEVDDALTVFARDASTGALTFVETQRDGVGGVDGLQGAHAVAISPDGAHAYVASATGDALASFSRDQATGRLTFLDAKHDGKKGVNGLDGAESLAVSPDGAHVYVAGRNDDALAVFSRDASSGLLTFVEMDRDNTAGISGLLGAKAVVVSGDGAYVYAAGSLEAAVAVFARDATTGHLTFVEVQRDGTNGVTGLSGVGALSVDGTSLYAAGRDADTVVAFQRDAATGRLTFVEAEEDGVAGVNGINGASGVVVSPDGAHVYVTGAVDNSIASFGRDAGTGALTYLGRERQGGTVDGMKTPEAVAMSADGANVYVAGNTDDAVAVFHVRSCGDGTVDPGEQCDDGNAVGGDCCSATCQFEAAASTCASDDNVCTDDVCDGAGSCQHVANTASCDDGLFCTVDDVCTDGVCHGAPRDCAGLGDACNEPMCDEATHQCGMQPKADGTVCDGGDACTRTHVCAAGACVDAEPVVCEPADACHLAGVCDPATGTCSNPPGPDGTACDDGNACTSTDTCAAGVCVGNDEITCDAADDCHAPGVCDPATGECSTPALPDGSACDDGDPCTDGDACAAGVCQPGATGDRDGDGVCDAMDLCPDVADPDQTDNNGDGVGDACECADPLGRCLGGGGPASTDCLVEFVVNGAPPTGKGVIRCVDGNSACDLDGAADGSCTFGVSLCVGNADPHFARCRPGDVRRFQVMSPNANSRSSVDHDNGVALEDTLGGMGAQVVRGKQTVSPFVEAAHRGTCSQVMQLVVPAPARHDAKPVRRTFKMRATSTDRRSDVDRLTLECGN